METPAARFVFEALVDIAPAVLQGETAAGIRRFIPITGGRVTGPDLSGEVLAGGADWQTLRPDGCTEIEAIYAIRAADGAVISVRNRGLVAPVEGGSPYVRTVAHFDAPKGAHDWLNRALFVGTLSVANAERTAVRVRIFQLD